MDDIDNLSYWDFIEITKYQSQNNSRQGGKTVYKGLKPSQRKMIETRKEKEKNRKGN